MATVLFRMFDRFWFRIFAYGLLCLALLGPRLSIADTPAGDSAVLESSVKNMPADADKTECICQRKEHVQSFGPAGEEVIVSSDKCGAPDEEGFYNHPNTAVKIAVMKNGVWRMPDYKGLGVKYTPQYVHCSAMKEDAEAKIKMVVAAFDRKRGCIPQGFASEAFASEKNKNIKSDDPLKAVKGWDPDACEVDMRNAETLQKGIFVLGNYKHAFHKETKLFMGWKFNEYLHLDDDWRAKEYGKQLFRDIVEVYYALTAGKCCGEYKKEYKKYEILHDRRGLGGYFPGTLDPPGSLGCCPAQCEPNKKEGWILEKKSNVYQCPAPGTKKRNVWIDPHYRTFQGVKTGEEVFHYEVRGFEDGKRDEAKRHTPKPGVELTQINTTKTKIPSNKQIKASLPTSVQTSDAAKNAPCKCQRMEHIQSFGKPGEAVVASPAAQCKKKDGFYSHETTAVKIAVMKNGIWRMPDYEKMEFQYEPQYVLCSEMEADAKKKIDLVVKAFDTGYTGAEKGKKCIQQGFPDKQKDRAGNPWVASDCEVDMRNAETLQKAVFVLGNYKHAFHKPTKSWMGWKFTAYLFLSPKERETEYGQKLYADCVEVYKVLTAGRCCSNFASEYKNYEILHDRRGLGGYFPGTLDPYESLGCCPAQCEPPQGQGQEGIECPAHPTDKPNVWIDPTDHSFDGDITGKEDFSFMGKKGKGAPIKETNTGTGTGTRASKVLEVDESILSPVRWLPKTRPKKMGRAILSHVRPDRAILSTLSRDT